MLQARPNAYFNYISILILRVEDYIQPEGRDFDQTLDLEKDKALRRHDERRQNAVEFHTRPVPAGDEAIEAAKQLMKKMGLNSAGRLTGS